MVIIYQLLITFQFLTNKYLSLLSWKQFNLILNKFTDSCDYSQNSDSEINSDSDTNSDSDKNERSVNFFCYLILIELI